MLSPRLRLPNTPSYQGLAFIDEGATAKVYKVLHRSENKEYALKKVTIPVKAKESKALED